MTYKWQIAAGIAGVGVLCAALIFGFREGAADCGTTQVAGGAIGGPFTLVDEQGKTVTDKDVIQGPTLVYFGYTFCPDVCPMDTARNAEAVEILEQRGHEVTPVFISIDPERDSPEVMRAYTDYLHPRMLGLTGSPEQVQAAASAYRAYFKKHPPEEGQEEFYLVDHSTFTYLMDGTGAFMDFFRRDEPAAQMADKVQCFLDKG